MNTKAAAQPDGVPRPLPAAAPRVMIIGLDGATFDVLNPLMAEGRMPRLREIIETGTSGILDSTTPPITPAAWTTFMTGKSPGTHGIIDFERYDVRNERLLFNTTNCLARVRSIFQILSDKGLRVGSVNVPMTYPPTPVNGFMISGFETPSIDADFTYPTELRNEILSRWPDYSYQTRWRRSVWDSTARFTDNLRYINRSFAQGAEMTEWCGRRFGWDLLMVVFKLVDNLQHKCWRYLDPQLNGRQSSRRVELVRRCFNAVDDAVGKLVDYARSQGAAAVIMSDHGHGRLEGKAQPNLLLQRWGYLKLGTGAEQTATRTRHVLHRLLFKKNGRFAANYNIGHDLAVDLSATRAAVIHAGMYGFLYVNLQGRQPGGIVTARDYEGLRTELHDRLREVTCTDRAGRSFYLFPEIHRPEELYGCARDERAWLPDLLLVPREGLAVVRKIRGTSAVQWLRRRRIEGTHRVEGILAASGPGIAPGGQVRAGIADVTPSILAMMGLPVPDDMEGRVIEGLFARPITVQRESVAAVTEAGDTDEAYSEAEKEKLTRRLADLGYLE